MITITETAVSEVKKVMDEQKMTIEEYALKVGVSGGGCSGFMYSLTFEKKENMAAADYFFKDYFGISVGVDKKSDLLLDGTNVDFYTGLDKRGFTFDNPNATKGCGCGKSFS